VGGFRLSLIASLVASSASAGILTPACDDGAKCFDIQRQLRYLLQHGANDIQVGMTGTRTTVYIQFSNYPDNFTDVVWNAAQRVSLLVNTQVYVTVTGATTFGHDQPRQCWLRFRKGQYLDGTC
jgi:hypothetical protein